MSPSVNQGPDPIGAYGGVGTALEPGTVDTALEPGTVDTAFGAWHGGHNLWSLARWKQPLWSACQPLEQWTQPCGAKRKWSPHIWDKET
ncbi:TPA: hypothetical protein ACH3X1_009297 [Trebouxia sp. C0004]